MFKILKRQKIINNNSINEIIEEIRHSFYTEVDKLLTKAKISNSLSTDKQVLINKYTKLKKLGFINTKEVKEAENEIKRLLVLREENKQKEILIKAINYFNFKYPHYKFITEESVKTICEKYNLVYGTINKYIGNIPDTNLKDIENFKIDKEDECYSKITISSLKIEEKYIDFHNYNNGKNRYDRIYGYITKLKTPLEIVAPLKDFELLNYKIKNFKISKREFHNLIVLKPVIFEDNKYYLIITA